MRILMMVVALFVGPIWGMAKALFRTGWYMVCWFFAPIYPTGRDVYWADKAAEAWGRRTFVDRFTPGLQPNAEDDET